jgi:hypothetical protein
MSAWALAKLRLVPPRPWLAALLKEADAQLPALGAQEMANLAWALGVWRAAPPGPWLARFLGQVSQAAQHRHTQQLRV